MCAQCACRNNLPDIYWRTILPGSNKVLLHFATVTHSGSLSGYGTVKTLLYFTPMGISYREAITLMLKLFFVDIIMHSQTNGFTVINTYVLHSYIGNTKGLPRDLLVEVHSSVGLIQGDDKQPFGVACEETIPGRYCIIIQHPQSRLRRRITQQQVGNCLLFIPNALDRHELPSIKVILDRYYYCSTSQARENSYTCKPHFCRSVGSCSFGPYGYYPSMHILQYISQQQAEVVQVVYVAFLAKVVLVVFQPIISDS